MSGADPVLVWTLTISLAPDVTGGSVRALRGQVHAASQREGRAFLWRTRGSVLTVHTEGSSGALAELAAWALENSIPELKGFELTRKLRTPLTRTEEWQGHA